jgi:hypothetical protein
VIVCLIFLPINAIAQQDNGHNFKNHPETKPILRKKINNLNFSTSSLPKKYVVIPNRSDSSLSILATPSGDMLKKITADDTGFKFEPIYASSLPRFKMIAVSDRMNSQLIFFDNRTFKFLGTAPASEGMFHMWPTPEQKELFAVADIDRVVDAIEINRFGNHVVYKHRVIDVGAEVETGKPHDVVVDKTHVYVTMLGVEGDDGSQEDLVFKFNRRSLKLEGTLKFSFDVHLGIPSQSPYLLVPETTAGKLNYVDKKTFKVVTDVEGLPGAHGIWWNNDASKIYLANFESQGPESIYTVRQALDTDEFSAKKLSTHDLADAKAHNVVVDFVNQVMFVTHSGPNVDGQLNRNISIFSVAGKPKFIKTVESGTNPLGILLVDRDL